jgi:hypothetical protein
MDRSSVVAVPKHIVSAKQGDCTVILDVNTGVYYTINAAASRLWGGILEGETLGELESRLARAYELTSDQAHADTMRFIHALSESTLVSV